MFSWRDLDLYLQSKLWSSSFKSNWLDGIHSLRKSNRPRIWSLTIRGMAFCKRIDFSDKNATLYCRESKCIFNICSDVKASATSSDFVNTKKYRKQKKQWSDKVIEKTNATWISKDMKRNSYPFMIIYPMVTSSALSNCSWQNIYKEAYGFNSNQQFPLSPDEGLARRFWYDELGPVTNHVNTRCYLDVDSTFFKR